jgi:hypothetical protein
MSKVAMERDAIHAGEKGHLHNALSRVRMVACALRAAWSLLVFAPARACAAMWLGCRAVLATTFFAANILIRSITCRCVFD